MTVQYLGKWLKTITIFQEQDWGWKILCACNPNSATNYERTVLFWCCRNHSLENHVLHNMEKKFCHNWCAVDYSGVTELPSQLQRTADEKFLPVEWEQKEKKREPQSASYKDCVLIGPQESRFSPLSIAWMIPQPVGTHQSKPARKEESIITLLIDIIF